MEDGGGVDGVTGGNSWFLEETDAAAGGKADALHCRIDQPVRGLLSHLDPRPHRSLVSSGDSWITHTQLGHSTLKATYQLNI